MANATYNLGDYKTSPQSKIFSGRPRGEWCRKQLHLDKHDAQSDTITIIIPDETYSVNMSFFLGLLGDSVRHYGTKGFYEHYRFVCDDVHRDSIHAGVEQALKEESVLLAVKSA